MPTLEELANQGSIINTHRNVTAPFKPSLRAGLSWRRNPFLNQCTVCFPVEHGVASAGAGTSAACARALLVWSVSAAADITTFAPTWLVLNRFIPI